MRVVPGVFLHGLGSPAVGVAFAKHRVHRAALDLVVARFDVLFFVVGRFIGIGRQIEALILKFLDGSFELRNGSADVRQLDDVGAGRLGQFAKLREGVTDLLVFVQEFREDGDDSAGERDVTRFNIDAGGLGKGLDNWKQRVSRQCGSFVGLGVDDTGSRGHGI